MKKRLVILIIPFCAIFVLFLIRLISPIEIDDMSPEIPCPELKEYNPDILWIIPFYNNISISENTEWCDYILSLNKTLGLHGIYHNYREFFYENITQEELNLAILEFEKCFGYKPDMFKPPQLKISEQNKRLIKDNNLQLRTTFHQTIHKVYHCNDEGNIKNKWIKLF